MRAQENKIQDSPPKFANVTQPSSSKASAGLKRVSPDMRLSDFSSRAVHMLVNYIERILYSASRAVCFVSFVVHLCVSGLSPVDCICVESNDAFVPNRSLFDIVFTYDLFRFILRFLFESMYTFFFATLCIKLLRYFQLINFNKPKSQFQK